jgi:hypothetical protein
VTQGLILKARAFRAARMRTHILKLFEIRIRILPRHCEERSDEAIHAATCGAMNCFASLAMTVEAVGWKRESRGYFIAPKRLSNEFDDTIGAEPATWAGAAGAGAAAAVSETDGFSAGLAAACLVSAFGAAA